MEDKNTVYMSEKQKVKEITDKLEAGLKELFESEKYKSYLSTMSKFHNYSFNNTLLIAMQKPEATLVAGYQAWQKNFERHVNKGEKAIRILAPAPYKIKEERDKLDPVTGEMMFDENGMPQKEETEVTIPAFRAVSVFDVSQTDGKPIPELEVNELLSTVEGYEDFVQALMNISPVPIAFEDIPGDSKGYFSTAEKRIAVQENMSESQTLKTMVHEVAHSRLHDKEVNQSMDIPVKDRNTKEVEAESVAFTVCQHFGIDTSDYSFGYIAGWSSGRNMKELKSSLDTIRKTASELITGIEGAMQELQLNREMEQEHGKESILLVHNEDFSEYNLVSVRGMDSAELISALSTMNEEDKSNISSYLESKGAWTTELADEQTEEAEEYHIDVRYNMDTDELIDVKERMEHPIDTNLSVMGQAEQLINQLEAEKNIFTSEERNLIVNYAYKLDDMNKTRELAEKLAYREQYAQQDVALTIIDAKAEIDALPDPMIGLSEMREYGYQWNEMLPLTQEKALELFEHDLPVYLLHTDGAESLAESRERIEEHEGIFGVEKETWNKALKQQTKITLKLLEIPGVMISDVEVREYPLGEAAAHLVGYVQSVTAEDLEEHAGEGYTANSVIGRSGMEGLFEKELKGQNGCRIYIVNSEDKEKEELACILVQHGQDIRLTIDTDLQVSLYEQFKEDKSCSVAINHYTGEVLALVSTPAYDNNDFIMGLSSEQWTVLNEDENKPMYNRFRQVWCPGSTFKPIIAAIGLQSGAIDPMEDYGNVGLSWQKDASWGSYHVTTLHAYEPVILENALIYSDNIYFAKAALKIGSDELENSLIRLGFNEELPFEIKMAESQYSNTEGIETEIQLADSGYGQGQILVNPLHMACIYSAFCNEGNVIKPYLVYQNEAEVEYWIPGAFSNETASRVLEGTKKVVNDSNGTGYAAHRDDILLAGKTGTAEIKASKDDTSGTELGWFAIFTAEDTECPILIISMVEDVKGRGGSGYVVKKDSLVLEEWFSSH